MMTLGTIVNAEPALMRLGAQPMKAKDRYTVRKLIERAKIELAHFHSERDEFIKQFGEETDGNWSIHVGSPKFPQFVAATNELAQVEVVIEGSISRLLLEELVLSPNDELLLEPFLG